MKITKIFTSIILLMSMQSCFIGSGEISEIKENEKNFFPNLIGIDLEGKKREIPQSFEGALNIIAIGFEREHQEPINTWIPEIEKIIKTNQNVKFYEVPLIYKLGNFSRRWVNNGMRFGITDSIARQRTITVYTDRDKFFNIMSMRGDRIYVLLLDKNGKILLKLEGISNNKKLSSLKKSINENS